jgi:hypothetical protein
VQQNFVALCCTTKYTLHIFWRVGIFPAPLKTRAAEATFHMQNRAKSPNKQKLRSAIDVFRELSDGGKSDDKIAAMLALIEGEETPVNRSTISRWRNYDPEKQENKRMEERIIAAASSLTKITASVVPLKIAVIPHSSEMIPILLLDFYKDWQDSCGVKVELEPMSLISQAMAALQRGDVDIAVGPRYSTNEPGYRKDRNFSEVCRFFEIGRLDVWGLFPFESNGNADFVEKITKLAERKQLRPGALRNASYGYAFESYLAPYHVPLPAAKEVRDSASATELLLNETYNCVIGHEAFAKNCDNNIQKETKKRSFFLSQDRLGQVTMDVFLNRIKTPAIIARRTLAIVNEAVEHILRNKADPSHELTSKVNKILGFQEGATYAMDGRDILQAYDFQIRSIDKDTLLAKWRV